jgi:cytochrome oxidase Cu insertion factor (SCO1/SenC/PrrC family)
MQNELEINKEEQRKGRMVFLMIAVFFTIPILVVVLMFKFNWKPTGQSIGELVKPPRLIITPSTLMDNKNNAQTNFWGDKWNIVFVANRCEKVCMDRLHDIRQIHVSTYKEIFRVQRVLITEQADVTNIQEKYPKLIIINQSTQDIASLATQFNINGEDALSSNRVYFVDPLGHIMMSYPLNTEAADIRKDLMRLLKFSWAG